jgi:hypothetical protein
VDEVVLLPHRARRHHTLHLARSTKYLQTNWIGEIHGRKQHAAQTRHEAGGKAGQYRQTSSRSEHCAIGVIRDDSLVLLQVFNPYDLTARASRDRLYCTGTCWP